MIITSLKMASNLLRSYKLCKSLRCSQCPVPDTIRCNISLLDPVDVCIRLTGDFVHHVLDMCDNGCKHCGLFKPYGCVFSITDFPSMWEVSDEYANDLSEFCMTNDCAECPFETLDGCFFNNFNPSDYSFSSIDAKLKRIFDDVYREVECYVPK